MIVFRYSSICARVPGKKVEHLFWRPISKKTPYLKMCIQFVSIRIYPYLFVSVSYLFLYLFRIYPYLFRIDSVSFPYLFCIFSISPCVTLSFTLQDGLCSAIDIWFQTQYFLSSDAGLPSALTHPTIPTSARLAGKLNVLWTQRSRSLWPLCF